MRPLCLALLLLLLAPAVRAESRSGGLWGAIGRRGATIYRGLLGRKPQERPSSRDVRPVPLKPVPLKRGPSTPDPEVTRGTIGDVIGRMVSDKKLQPSVFRHYKLEDQRYVSRAFKRANPDLGLTGFAEQVLTRSQATALRARLQRIEQRPAKDWMTALEAAAGRTRSKRTAQALQRIADELHKAYFPKDLKQRSDIAVNWYKSFISMWLRRHQNWRVDRMLPGDLPALPQTAQPELGALVQAVRGKGNVQRQLVELERQATWLQASAEPRERARGRELGRYLARYKQGWAGSWLARRMNKFANSQGPEWHLRSHLRAVNGAGPTQDVERRLDQAWALLRGLVSPALLRRLPPVKVVVDGKCSRAEHRGDTITIAPHSPVSTILHELGHHIEEHGGLRMLVLAQSLRMERSRGPARPLGQRYKPDEEAFVSSFKNPYAAKKYKLNHGATEVISMALQRFSSSGEAKRFLAEDGEYALKVLYALQEKPPWP